MPKTIAITPSWYWPAAIPRVLGVPPFSLGEALVQRWARHRPDDVALADSSVRLTGRQFVEQVMTAAVALRVRSAATPGPARFSAGASVEGAVLLLAALEAGIAIRLVAPSPQRAPDDGPAPVDGGSPIRSVPRLSGRPLRSPASQTSLPEATLPSPPLRCPWMLASWAFPRVATWYGTPTARWSAAPTR